MKKLVHLYTFIFILFNQSLFAQNVGIGQPSPISRLDVNGGLTVGASFSGFSPAPANGFNVQGQGIIGVSTPIYPNDIFEAVGNGGSFANSAYVTNGVAAGTNILSCGLYSSISGTGGVGVLVDHLASADFGILVNAQNPVSVAGVKGDANADGPHGVYGEQQPFSFFSFAIYANGDIGYTGGIYLASDRSLKTNITDYNDATSLVMNLRPRSYRYKSDMVEQYGFKSQEHAGFIAQELEEVLPSSVRTARLVSKSEQTRTSKDGESIQHMTAKTVDYVSLIPILTKAIQEQQVQILKLEEQIKQLSVK